MTIDLETRLSELFESLGGYGASDFAPASLGKVFNALLEEAKKAKPGDPIVAAIDPVGLGGGEYEFADSDCGALQALIQQLLSALRD